MLSLREFRSKAKGLPDLLPYAALIAPDVVLNKDGSFLAAWLIRGEDTDSSTPDELANVSARMNSAAMLLGSGYVVHVDAVRLPELSYPAPDDSHFPDRVTSLIDQERRAAFSRGQYYSTRTGLSITWRPALSDQRLLRMAQGVGAENLRLEKDLETFRGTLQSVEDALSSVLHMERLSSFESEDRWGKPFVFSELLSYLQLCLTGEDQPIRVPHTPMYLDAILGGEDLIGGLAPRLGRKHLAVISIDSLPTEAWPSILSTLATVPMSLRFSTRFICLDQHEALLEVDKYRKTWSQQIYRFFDTFFNNPKARPNRDAQSMSENAEEIFAHVQGGLMGMGFYSATLVLANESPDELETWWRQLRREISELGFGCRLETINAVEAWLGSHPGNFYANIRRPLISSMNLADLLPLASVWPGREHNPSPMLPARSPALMHCATDGATPFRLNIHVGDLGHTLIFGPTRSGKSTLLATMAAQFRRYSGASIFSFDKGLSMYRLTKAVGGKHYEIGGSDSPSFCPLFHLESDTEQSWAEEWLATCCTLQGLTVLPNHRNAIHTAASALRSNPHDMRSLTDFWAVVQDDQVKDALQHYTNKGAMGHLLDASEDSLAIESWMTFEIEELMNLGDKNLIPVLLYLFHRIEKAMSGQPCLLLLDEAWIMLGHPVFREKIREWLKVMAKANCAVVLATQSLSDASRSGILDVLTESCPTKIFLPNEAARQDVQRELYTVMGCNSRQIEIIATATRKRDYYLMSPEGRRLFSLALGKLALTFVGAGTKEAAQHTKELEKLHGNKWVDVLLEERGITWALD